MFGHFFQPSSRSFLGGKIGQIVAPLALSLLAPGIGTAIGSTLGAGAAWAPSVGNAVLGAGFGGLTGGAKGALTGGLTGGLSGYLSGPGGSDLLNSTGLSSVGDGISSLYHSTGLDSVGNALGLGGQTNPEAARSAISATASAPQSLTGVTPGASSNLSGGGGPGGFYAAAPATTSSFGVDSLSGNLDKFANAPAAGAVQTAAASAPGFFQEPLKYIGNTLSNEADNVFSSGNLLKGGLKAGLTYGSQDTNTGGYNALRGAANQAQGYYTPYVAGGQRANAALSDLYGLNGAGAAQSASQDWQNTPGYQFVLQQGIKARDASAAARGMLLSGNQEQTLQQYGSGLADQYYQNYINNLQQQAGMGLNAAGGAGQAGIDAATAYAAMKGQKANARNQMFGSLTSLL